MSSSAARRSTGRTGCAGWRRSSTPSWSARRARPHSQMTQEPFGERLGMLPVHEMSAGDLLDQVLVLEHSRGAPVVGWLGDRIVPPRKGDHWHLDLRLQRRAGYGGELAVIAEGRVQARRV